MAGIVTKKCDDLDLPVFRGSESTLEDKVNEKIAILKRTKLTRIEQKFELPEIGSFLKSIYCLEPEKQNREIGNFATSLLQKVSNSGTRFEISTPGNSLENLLQLGADPDASILIRPFDFSKPLFYGSPLHLACRNRSLAEIELLLKYKANPKGNKCSKTSPLEFFTQSIVSDCQFIAKSFIIPVSRRVELMKLRDDVEALFSKYA